MNGFFQDKHGNKSSSRLAGIIVIVCALIFAQEVLWFGREDVVLAAAAAGTIFLTIAGPAMGFLFWQKKTEVEDPDNKKTL